VTQESRDGESDRHIAWQPAARGDFVSLPETCGSRPVSDRASTATADTTEENLR